MTHPVELPCGHKAWNFCWNRYRKRNLVLRGIIGCPQCEKTLRDELLKKKAEAASDPTKQFCPFMFCDKIVDVRKIDLSNPKTITCEDGHSFCDVCNEQYHGNLSCRNAKPFLKLYDEPKTILCPYWNIIIQLSKLSKTEIITCEFCK